MYTYSIGRRHCPACRAACGTSGLLDNVEVPRSSRAAPAADVLVRRPRSLDVDHSAPAAAAADAVAAEDGG